MSRAEERLALRVTVVHLRPGLDFVRPLELPAPATIAEAIRASGVLAAVPDLDAAALDVGVFGQPRRLGDLLRDGDRVEVYRPLTIEPRQARRIRAEIRRRRKAGTATPGG